MPDRSDIELAAVGLLAGGASGLLGVGGGVVMVPGLVLVARMAQRRAHATSLAAVIPIGTVGATTYLVRGDVHLALAGALAAGSLIGAPLGVRALERIPERALRAVFVAVAIVSAIRLLTSGAAGGASLPPVAIGPADAAVAFAIGVFAGAFAGLLGVGGGVVMVPAMTMLLGQGQHVAQGTSLLVIIVTATAATRASAARGLLDARAAMILGLSGVAAAVAGAVGASALDDVTLKRIFGYFLIAAVIRLAADGLRRPRADGGARVR